MRWTSLACTARAALDMVWPLGCAAGIYVLGVLTQQLGIEVHLLVATVLGAALGVVAVPRVRQSMERHAARSSGVWPLALTSAAAGALLAVLGLTVVVAAAVATIGIQAVLTVPTARRLVEVGVSVMATSAATVTAQARGWVDGVIPVPASILIGAALLAFLIPVVIATADASRRAQVTAAALDAERQRHIAELEHSASHDPLTGLLGRRGLTEPLRCAAADASAQAQTAVVFIDLDGFKAVNDEHGHAAGDELLITVAKRLERCVRSGDVVARMGGDEFVLVLQRLRTTDEAEAVTARVHREVGRDIVLSDASVVNVSASIGLVVCSHPHDAGELLSRADAAMYAAKRAVARAHSPAPSLRQDSTQPSQDR